MPAMPDGYDSKSSVFGGQEFLTDYLRDSPKIPGEVKEKRGVAYDKAEKAEHRRQKIEARNKFREQKREWRAQEPADGDREARRAWRASRPHFNNDAWNQ